MSFDKVPDVREREYLMGLPTSFVLPRDAVDRRRASAAALPRQSPEYGAFVREMGGTPAP